MEKYKRKDLNGRYFLVEIFECPGKIIEFAAHLGGDNVTIENFANSGRRRAKFDFDIQLDGLHVHPSMKRFDVDFSITKPEFMTLIEVWDEQGCYALFYDAPVLKFKATHLAENQRYRALENFGWKIEIDIPGSASSGWGRIVSPNKEIIDKIEEQLKHLGY